MRSIWLVHTSKKHRKGVVFEGTVGHAMGRRRLPFAPKFRGTSSIPPLVAVAVLRYHTTQISPPPFTCAQTMRTLSLYLLLGIILHAVEASRFSLSPPAFFNRFSDFEEEYEEEEEGPGLGGLALKALVGASVAAVGGAGVSFARRAIKAKQQRVSTPKQQRSHLPSSSTVGSSTPSFVESGIKGGKSDPKIARGTTTMAPPSSTEADGSGEEAEKEPEEVFDVEPVVELDESKLSEGQKEHPYAKLLGPKLVKYDSKQGKLVEVATADVLDGKVTSLFFHAQQVEQMLEKMKAGKVLPGLKEVYAEQRAKGNNFEVVFMSLPDGQEGRFQAYMKDMPWYAVPFNATERLRDAYKAFKIQNLPAAVVVDEQAQVLNEKGFTYMLIDKEGFPWHPKTLSQMLGSTFLSKDRSVPAAEVAKKKVLALYFSANWCKPCQEFTPKLVEAYEKVRAQGKDLEVVFVSMDETEEKFKEYFAKMPWLSLPYEDKTARSLLMTELEVKGLPTLVLLDEEREVITSKGRDFVLKDPEGAKFPWYPQPLNEISYSFDGIAQKPSLVLFMEGASADAQAKMVAAMQAVAEEFTAKNKLAPEDAAHRFNFYYAQEISTFSKALRSIAGLEQLNPKDKFLKSKAESNKPRLVLLDIAKEVCHVSPAEDAGTVEETTIRELLQARVEGTLPMETFRQPEPEEAGASASAKGAGTV